MQSHKKASMLANKGTKGCTKAMLISWEDQMDRESISIVTALDSKATFVADFHIMVNLNT